MILASCSITLTHQIDISAVYWFYLLQSSTAAAPSKPTAAQATAFINNGALPGNWVLAEPTYTENSTMSLYVVELTQYSDATGAWSEVSLSSSYEAAKIAYNKAQVAQDSVDGIDVGGRNLILGTAQPVQSADSSNGSAYTGANRHLFSDYGTELFINNTTDEFTISYDYEVFGAESQEGHSAYIYNQVNGAQVAKTTVYLTSASETGHASFTAKLNTTQAEHSNRPFTLRFRLRYAVDGAYFIIRNVKLEKGNKATDWTPAPEDIDSSIATAQSAATTAQSAANTAQSTGESNSLQIGKLAEQTSQIQQLIDQIRLWVSSIANKSAWVSGQSISAYETDEKPTLDNYPAATEFWTWPICATNKYCSDTLICGTNNYSSHKYDIAYCTSENAYYIFDQDSTNSYYWREMTEAEYKAKSNLYSSINIESDCIELVSILNTAETLVSITSAGVTVSAGKLFCC